MIEFKLPEVGENVKSGTVTTIFVKVGDTIKKDQDLLEIETDKASLPIPSSISGVVKEILIKPGQKVNIGQVVMKVEESSGAASAAPVKSSPKPAETAPAATKKAEAPVSQPVAAKAVSAPAASYTPAPATAKDVPAAPSVRKLARELGVNVASVPGTGPAGRISIEDVKNFVKQAMTSGGGVGGASVASRPLPNFAKWGTVERQPMNNIRQKTAEHLSYAWQSIPHVTQFAKADITELEKLRKRYSSDKRKLTITPFLMKVMASALKTFPQFNASIDMQTNEIIYKKYFNIGVAVDTDRGLLVPVIRDVEKKSIFQIADEVNAIAGRARDKKLTLDDMQGGSITLTNLGGVGGTAFTPIVNWPEVAILGVSRGGLEPVYDNGQFLPRLMLPLSLSYDHRIIDGADGARFIKWVCDAIEQPFMMELEK